LWIGFFIVAALRPLTQGRFSCFKMEDFGYHLGLPGMGRLGLLHCFVARLAALQRLNLRRSRLPFAQLAQGEFVKLRITQSRAR
jgi:hypothetical protein